MADDEDESLDEILSSSTEETVEETTTEETTEAPKRDEHGRFAPKEGDEETTEATTETEEADADTHPENKVPPGLIEERRKRQEANARADALERQLAEVRGQVQLLAQQRQQPEQPKAEVKPRDFWEDPNAFVNEALTPVQQQLQKHRLDTSRMLADDKFGSDVVSAAEKALEDAARANPSDPGIRADYQRIMASPHAYKALVDWHKQRAALTEIGDPTAYREKVRAEIMAELVKAPDQQQSTTQPSRAPVVKLPPSLSRVPAGHSAPERDESLDEVLSQPRRRA